MSEFACEVVKIDEVIDHPNADRLSIVKIGGYNCVSAKLEDGSPRYKAGDLVVYIPENALLPEWLLKKMGFWNEEKQTGTLSGSKGNRVKACKLRGELSQGVLYSVRLLQTLVYPSDSNDNIYQVYGEYSETEKLHNSIGVKLGDDVSEFLGITKYEPVIPQSMRGQITGGLFGYTKSYDIENAQKYPNAFAPEEMVVCHEKVHGTLIQIGFLNHAPDTIKHELFKIDNKYDDNVYAYVTSKGLAKQGIIQKNTEENKDNLYIRIYNEFIKNKAQMIVERFILLNNLDNGENLTWALYIFGEVYGAGVQDLKYGKQKPEFAVFDVFVKIGNKEIKEGYLSTNNLTNWCIGVDLPKVPLVYSGPFKSLEFLDQFRTGETIIGNKTHIREGIVIRPHKERSYPKLPDNRLQLKYVSPDYLLRKDGTEYT